MDELRELYQEVILDHSRNPRNFHEIEDGRRAEGFNPLCGDRVVVFVKLKKDRIEDLSFRGTGCAISTASVSMMTEALKGKTIDEAEKFFTLFHDLVTGRSEKVGGIGKLEIFRGVQEFPTRVKCATLAWHTLKAALEGKKELIKTE